MSTKTATVANAPILNLSGLYDAPGIDLIIGYDENSGTDWEHVEWIDYTGEDEFNASVADDMLREAGYRRVGEWNTWDLSDYAFCDIERIGA